MKIYSRYLQKRHHRGNDIKIYPSWISLSVNATIYRKLHPGNKCTVVLSSDRNTSCCCDVAPVLEHIDTSMGRRGGLLRLLRGSFRSLRGIIDCPNDNGARVGDNNGVVVPRRCLEIEGGSKQHTGHDHCLTRCTWVTKQRSQSRDDLLHNDVKSIRIKMSRG